MYQKRVNQLVIRQFSQDIMALISLLLLILCLADIQCQTFPYVSFMGQTLANNSYVDLSLVGNDDSGSDSVQCHTDLNTCCSARQGPNRGDWYFPNGYRLRFPIGSGIAQSRQDRRVELRQTTDTGRSGIYRCDIETSGFENGIRETVYVGLYSEGGKFAADWCKNYLR